MSAPPRVVTVSGEREHTFTDPAGAEMRIEPSAVRPDTAWLTTDDDILVPAHRLAEFTRALWSAAGQPVPDLPVIYDPALVEALARDIHKTASPSDYAGHLKPAPAYEIWAKALLDAGWRKP